MKYGRVLTYKNSEEAKELIGKKVVGSDYLYAITENPETRCISVLESTTDCVVISPLFKTSDGNYQFIREVIEEKPQLMTHRQLAEWIAKGNGEYSSTSYNHAFSSYDYTKEHENDPVSDKVLIRPWDSEEWVIPTVDIYERDCK